MIMKLQSSKLHFNQTLLSLALLVVRIQCVASSPSPISSDESIVSYRQRIQQHQKHRLDQWRVRNLKQNQMRHLQQKFEPAPLEMDRVKVLEGIEGANGVSRAWADSYSVKDECFCDTTYDHGIGDVLVRSPLFNDEEMTVRDVCETIIGPGPGNYDIDPRPSYNDIQCGNGPPNDAGDENVCPGRVEHGKAGCSSIGPTWNWEKAYPYDPIELKDGNELRKVLDFEYYLNDELLSVNVLIDVRSEAEFKEGHIENATLLSNLADFKISKNTNNNDTMVTETDETIANPLEIIGCQYCDIVVYCQSGARAARAIEVLRRSGFKGHLINGLGINQWTKAGHKLVKTPSTEPGCASTDSRDSIVCTERWLQYKMQRDNNENEEPTVSPTKQREPPSDQPSLVPSDQPSYMPSSQPSKGRNKPKPVGNMKNNNDAKKKNQNVPPPVMPPVALYSSSLIPSDVPSLLEKNDSNQKACIPIGSMCIDDSVCCNSNVCNNGKCSSPATMNMSKTTTAENTRNRLKRI